jgi:DNA-binding NarL/FixJ family response regulator
MLSAASDIQIVGEAENGNDVQSLVAQLRPQILLLDIKMPGPAPAEIVRWVRINFPETAMLVLTSHDRDAYLVSMMDAGAAGWLSTEVPADGLIGAIKRAANGEILFDEQQLNRAELWRKVAGEKWESLSDRQKQILQLLAQGADRAEVADLLEIGLRAVEYHIYNLSKKLKIRSLTDAVNWVHKYLPDDLERVTG